MNKATLHDDELKAAYARTADVARGLYDDEAAFLKSVNDTYGQSGRFFHGIGHLLEMTGQEDPWTQQAYSDLNKAMGSAYADKPLAATELQELKNINFIAALGHDFEYHVDGKTTEYGEKTLAQYVEPVPGLPTRIQAKEITPETDAIAWATYEIFEQKAGGNLSIFNGQNEFLSALVLAKKLEEAKIAEHGELTTEDKKFIVGVIASVAATVPFKDAAKFQLLRNRVEKVAAEFGLDDPTRTADALTANATLLANKDVLGFGGELFQRNTDLKALLDQHNGDTEAATKALLKNLQPEDLQKSFASGDHLNTEEDPDHRLQRSTSPGKDYTALDMLSVAFKRVRLDNMLKDKENLYHSVEIGAGDDKVSYPPKEVVRVMNQLATNSEGTGTIDILDYAYKARVAALSIVHSVAMAARLQSAELAVFVKGVTEKDFERDQKEPATVELQQALDVLRHRRHGLQNDIPNSPLASTLLSHSVDADALDKAYQLAETQYGRGANGKPAAQNSQQFLDDLREALNPNLVQSMTDKIGATALRNTEANMRAGGIKKEDDSWARGMRNLERSAVSARG